MLGRIAVPHMTPVARARYPHSITRAPRPTGSPAWAVPTTGTSAVRRRPASSPSCATRRAAAAPARGAVHLDLPVTVH